MAVMWEHDQSERLLQQPSLAAVKRQMAVTLTWLNACRVQITGFFVAIITVLATCLDAGLQGKAFLTGDVKGDIERLEEGGGAGEAAQGDDLPYRPDWFHFCFALASMYIAMVFTGKTPSAVSQYLRLPVEIEACRARCCVRANHQCLSASD